MKEEKKTPQKGLSKMLKRFYGVGDCGFTLMSNIESYYFSFFLTNLAQFSLPMVTLITTISSTGQCSSFLDLRGDHQQH